MENPKPYVYVRGVRTPIRAMAINEVFEVPNPLEGYFKAMDKKGNGPWLVSMLVKEEKRG